MHKNILAKKSLPNNIKLFSIKRRIREVKFRFNLGFRY